MAQAQAVFAQRTHVGSWVIVPPHA
jgi:hypothetical protein